MRKKTCGIAIVLTVLICLFIWPVTANAKTEGSGDSTAAASSEQVDGTATDSSTTPSQDTATTVSDKDAATKAADNATNDDTSLAASDAGASDGTVVDGSAVTATPSVSSQPSLQSMSISVQNTSNAYVSASGDDVTGNGTAASPYATLGKAYGSLPDAGGVICVMDDLTATATTKFDTDNKNVTITSDDANDATQDDAFTIKRDSSFTDGVILDIEAGCVTLQGITLDGGAVWSGEVETDIGRGKTNDGIEVSKELVSVGVSGSLELASDSVLQNNAATSNGVGGVYSLGTVTIDGGTIRDCFALGSREITVWSSISDTGFVSASAILAATGNFFFKSGLITGNDVGVANAVPNFPTCTLTIIGAPKGELSNHSYVMSGGTISNNCNETQQYNATVLLYKGWSQTTSLYTEFYIKGGSIVDNVGGGEGVTSVNWYASIYLGGDAPITITGNHDSHGRTMNVYLNATDGSAMLLLDSALDPNSRIGFYDQAIGFMTDDIPFAQGADGYVISASDADCFLTDNTSESGVLLKNDHILYLSTSAKGEARLITSAGKVTYGTLSELWNSVASGDMLEILTDKTSTVISNGDLASGATIKTYSGSTYKATGSDTTTLDVSAAGVITLKGGSLECSAGVVLFVLDGATPTSGIHSLTGIVGAGGKAHSFTVSSGAGGMVGELAAGESVVIDGITYTAAGDGETFPITGGLASASPGDTASVPAGTAASVALATGVSVSVPSGNAAVTVLTRVVGPYVASVVLGKAGDVASVCGNAYVAGSDGLRLLVGTDANAPAVLDDGAVVLESGARLDVNGRVVKNTAAGTGTTSVDRDAATGAALLVVPSGGRVCIGDATDDGFEYSNTGTEDAKFAIDGKGDVVFMSGAVECSAGDTLVVSDGTSAHSVTGIVGAGGKAHSFTVSSGAGGVVGELAAGESVVIDGITYTAAGDGETFPITGGLASASPGDMASVPAGTAASVALATGVSVSVPSGNAAVTVLTKGESTSSAKVSTGDSVTVGGMTYTNDAVDGTEMELGIDSSTAAVSLVSGVAGIEPGSKVVVNGSTVEDPTASTDSVVVIRNPATGLTSVLVKGPSPVRINGVEYDTKGDSGTIFSLEEDKSVTMKAGAVSLAAGQAIKAGAVNVLVSNPSDSGKVVLVRADVPGEGQVTVSVPASGSVLIGGRAFAASGDESMDIVIDKEGNVSMSSGTTTLAPGEKVAVGTGSDSIIVENATSTGMGKVTVNAGVPASGKTSVIGEGGTSIKVGGIAYVNASALDNVGLVVSADGSVSLESGSLLLAANGSLRIAGVDPNTHAAVTTLIVNTGSSPIIVDAKDKVTVPEGGSFTVSTVSNKTNLLENLGSGAIDFMLDRNTGNTAFSVAAGQTVRLNGVDNTGGPSTLVVDPEGNVAVVSGAENLKASVDPAYFDDPSFACQLLPGIPIIVGNYTYSSNGSGITLRGHAADSSNTNPVINLPNAGDRVSVSLSNDSSVTTTFTSAGANTVFAMAMVEAKTSAVDLLGKAEGTSGLVFAGTSPVAVDGIAYTGSAMDTVYSVFYGAANDSVAVAAGQLTVGFGEIGQEVTVRKTTVNAQGSAGDNIFDALVVPSSIVVTHHPDGTSDTVASDGYILIQTTDTSGNAVWGVSLPASITPDPAASIIPDTTGSVTSVASSGKTGASNSLAKTGESNLLLLVGLLVAAGAVCIVLARRRQKA